MAKEKKPAVKANDAPTQNQEKPVADELPTNPSPFDVPTVKALVALMAEHELYEIDLRKGNERIRLLKSAPQTVVSGPAPMMMHAAPSAQAPAPASGAKDSASGGKQTGSSKKLVEIKSPSVGTFYSAPNPESPPYVKVGAKVSNQTVVGLIEAMKLYNEITADCSGTIEEILVKDKESVEFGQVLFRVDPN